MISLLGKVRIRWQLMFYDVVIYLIVLAFIATTYGLAGSTREEFILGSVAALAALLICRTLGMVYSMIIRYGGVHVYMRLFATDFFVILAYFPIKFGLGLTHMTSQRWLILVLLNLLGAVGIRLMYRYCYRYGVRRNSKGKFLRSLLLLFAGDNVVKERRDEHKRIRIAILGAGRLGAVLPPYAVYNIGNNSPENLLDFVDVLQQELVRAGVLPADYDFEAHKELVPMQPGDVPVTYADTSALERDFGFKPSTSLREGLRKFAEWYKEFYM